ncbi:MAG: hypothetical protein GX556_16660 [Fibrobacter sp.]|nr:hypothetical protein [Fibrobacter sp.]
MNCLWPVTPPFRRKQEAIFSYTTISWMPFFNGMTIRGSIAEKVTCVLSSSRIPPK